MCELETETAVDDAESDGNATQPDVSVGPQGTVVVLLEKGVVQEAEDRLEEKRYEDDYANDGMMVIGELHFRCEIHSKPKASNVDKVAKDLESGVDPYHTGEGDEADGNGTGWKEDDESEGRKYAMRDQHCSPVSTIVAPT